MLEDYVEIVMTMTLKEAQTALLALAASAEAQALYHALYGALEKVPVAA